MSSDDLRVTIIVGLAISLPAVTILGWVVSANWRRARVAEQEAVLKQSLIERGSTADDIVKVLAAGSEPQAAVVVTASALIDKLISEGYDGDDVTAITAAADDLPPSVRADVTRVAIKMASNWYDGDDIRKFIAARAEAARTADVHA